MTIPETPMQDDEREEEPRSVAASSLVRAAEEAHDPRRQEDEEAGRAAEDDEDEPEERRGDRQARARCSFSSSSLKTGTNAARERHVRGERPHEVRDLERDREGVDLPSTPK